MLSDSSISPINDIEVDAEGRPKCALAIYTKGKECSNYFTPNRPWQICCSRKHTARLRQLKFTDKVKEAMRIAEEVRASASKKVING